MIASFRTERGDLEKTMNPKKDMDCFYGNIKDASQSHPDRSKCIVLCTNPHTISLRVRYDSLLIDWIIKTANAYHKNGFFLVMGKRSTDSGKEFE